MNNYIMKKINIYGTEIQLLEAIRDFLISNTVMRFSLIEENFTDTSDKKNSIKLENDDYILEVYGESTTNTSTSNGISWYLFKNNEDKTPLFTFTTNSASTSVTRIASTPRIINIFILKGDNLEFINVGSYSSTYGKNNSPYYMRMSTSDVGLVYCINTSSSTPEVIDYETRTLCYELCPYHELAASDDTLILDSELPLCMTTYTKYYSGIVNDCFGLGGGIVRTFYKDSNGTPLYCFANNCCFKLENKVEI